MELINFIGAQPSKDGKWLLVSFARKGSDEKFRFIVPYGAQTAYESETKYYVLLSKSKNDKKEKTKEEPKEEHEPLEDEIPF